MKMCKNCYVEPQNDPIPSRGLCAYCLDDEYGKDCLTKGCGQGTFNEDGICDDCLERENECESCQGTGIDMHAHNSTAPKDVGSCKSCRGKG